MCTYVFIHTYIYVCVRTYAHTYVRSRIHTYTYIQTYTYTYSKTKKIPFGKRLALLRVWYLNVCCVFNEKKIKKTYNVTSPKMSTKMTHLFLYSGTAFFFLENAMDAALAEALTEAVWGLGIAGLEIANKNVFSHSSC